QLVALLEGVPGERFGRPGFRALEGLTDVVAVEERPVTAAQVAHLDGQQVDLQHAVAPRDAQEFQGGREVNVAVARATDDAFPRLGELTLLALQRAAGEREGDLHSHLLLPLLWVRVNWRTRRSTSAVRANGTSSWGRQSAPTL